MKLKLLLITLLILFITNTKTFALDYVNGKFERIYSEEEVKKDPSKMNKGRMVITKKNIPDIYFLYENGKTYKASIEVPPMARTEYAMRAFCTRQPDGNYKCVYGNSKDETVNSCEILFPKNEYTYVNFLDTKDYIMFKFFHDSGKEVYCFLKKADKTVSQVEGDTKKGDKYLSRFLLKDNQILLGGNYKIVYKKERHKFKFFYKMKILDPNLNKISTLKDWRYIWRNYVFLDCAKYIRIYTLEDGRFILAADMYSEGNCPYFELFTPKDFKK